MAPVKRAFCSTSEPRGFCPRNMWRRLWIAIPSIINLWLYFFLSFYRKIFQALVSTNAVWDIEGFQVRISSFPQDIFPASSCCTSCCYHVRISPSLHFTFTLLRPIFISMFLFFLFLSWFHLKDSGNPQTCTTFLYFRRFENSFRWGSQGMRFSCVR